MPIDVAESVTIGVPPAAVYQVVSDVRRMARYSSECFACWVWSRDGGAARFVGFNRRGAFVWFTTCRVVIARADREFSFDVATFGMPVARWGYRLAAVPGGTEVTEYWQDRRSRGAGRLGRIFTGRSALDRPEINRTGMRVTLQCLKSELETAPTILERVDKDLPN